MSNDVTKMTRRNMISFILLGMAVAIIYFIPYARQTYYTQMQQAMHINNTQMGDLASLYGIVALISYFPSGILADKFSPRLLLTISFFTTGLLTLWHATFPSYTVLLIIYGGFGATSILTFWSAYLKALRLLADEKDQGKVYGGNEGIKWLTRTIIAVIGLWIFGLTADAVQGFRMVLIFSGVLYIAFGFALWFFISDDTSSLSNKSKEKFSFKLVIDAFKLPGTWLLAVLVFCAYLIYSSTSYLTPYLVIMGMSASTASVVAIVRNYLLGILAVVVGGFLSDRSSSRSKLSMILFAMIGVIFVGMMFITGGKNLGVLSIILACVVTFLFTSFRGIYWATMGEAGISIKMTGIVTGIVSLIGYAPDAFIYSIWGRDLDAHPGLLGYKIIFIWNIGACIVGLIIAMIIMKASKKNLAVLEAETKAMNQNA